MSLTRLPRLGSVAWAKLEDANGFCKIRPVAVVTPTAEIAPMKLVRVVAITTRLPNPLPDDHVLLPWDRLAGADATTDYPNESTPLTHIMFEAHESKIENLPTGGESKSRDPSW